MGAIIRAENLTKDYVTYERGSGFGDAVKSLFIRKRVVIRAVDSISFEIEQGSIVGLLGKNGAGKSSTIKMLTGVLFPTSGKVESLGYNPFTQRSKYVSRIGALFGQKSQLIWDIPPMDSFLMNKAIYDIPTADFNKQLALMTELFGIEDIVKKPTRVLSLGERMKCEFLMAMLHSPEIVFLDEPTIGLDIQAKEIIRNFIKEMNRQGVTFILTTHDIEDVERLAQRVIIVNHGKKVFDDKLAALKQHLGNRKTVSITTKTPTAHLDIDGVQVISAVSDYERELAVDQSIISLNSFIEYAEKLGEIMDIDIKGPRVEDIIKSIYEK